ncbi:HD domain-containing protein [Eudoraea sp.]|uniref:HD domain-containing protein n=1 Tax=Eudoraea sp. TaxID=1979955 RepID=UPI003C73AD78
MTKSSKLKIFNDPIYGFIRIPDPLIFDLIEDPYFQRLRRISQMGLSYLVFPGAHHTRFHHALGSMHLMMKAVQLLKDKGVDITEEESLSLLIAILLHDIGHGPFSHAMENSLVEGTSHEFISLYFMELLNVKFNGSLTMAIEIFTGSYPKKFLNELVCSQLDMDRLDYLKRDSFYTGVAEGNINAERLITMLNVVDGHLVVEKKGLYPVEKFLMARRFMYWQVYLHKTGLVAEQLLINILRRAKELVKQGVKLNASRALTFFLVNTIDQSKFNETVLTNFALLDDVDIMSAIKEWSAHPDYVLSNLCTRILNRKLLKIKLRDHPINKEKFNKYLDKFRKDKELTEAEAKYFVFQGQIENTVYNHQKQLIRILHKNGNVSDIASVSDDLNLSSLSNKTTKFYLCFPKD